MKKILIGIVVSCMFLVIGCVGYVETEPYPPPVVYYRPAPPIYYYIGPPIYYHPRPFHHGHHR